MSNLKNRDLCTVLLIISYNKSITLNDFLINIGK